MSIKIARFTKSIFVKFKLHLIFGFLEGFFTQLTQLIKMSRWISENRQIDGNDFFQNGIMKRDLLCTIILSKMKN